MEGESPAGADERPAENGEHLFFEAIAYSAHVEDVLRVIGIGLYALTQPVNVPLDDVARFVRGVRLKFTDDLDELCGG